MENKRNVKDMVSNGKKVTLLYYRKRELIYETECGFQFAVPIEDTGDAEFLPKDKAILFMRWIRKALKGLEV